MDVPLPAADPARAACLSKGWFVAVDPAVLHPAAAVFDRGVLVAASRVKIPGAWAKLDRGERTRAVGKKIATWCLEACSLETPLALVTEVPEVYGGRGGRGDPNDLILLALVCGAVAGYLDVETIGVLPKEWTGGVKKGTTGDPWASPRGGIIRRRLSAAEFAVVVPSHDAIDAVGIGLRVLYRLERTLPGTTV